MKALDVASKVISDKFKKKYVVGCYSLTKHIKGTLSIRMYEDHYVIARSTQLHRRCYMRKLCRPSLERRCSYGKENLM